MQTSVGDALGFIAVVVGLGAMIGRFLQYSGAAGPRRLALAKAGPRHAQWAVLITAFLVGLPVFFEVGFVILAPLAWSLARESKRSLLLFGLPIAAALTAIHALVPPHPAPAVAAQLMGADMGRIILWGAILSIPLMIVAGIFYGGWIAKRISPPVPEMAGSARQQNRKWIGASLAWTNDLSPRPPRAADRCRHSRGSLPSARSQCL